MVYNLQSPSGIRNPCDLENLSEWFRQEVQVVPAASVRTVLEAVRANLDEFVGWPTKALLLWKGCDRIPEPGKRQKYFSYPASVKLRARQEGLRLDTRPNGPAIAAYTLAGGTRPTRLGSTNAWSVHHLYSGKFPFLGRVETTHASKAGCHFTQAAGLVAVHPIADALVDEFPCFAWLLRSYSFLRFGYDPDGVFSPSQDELGFAAESSCEIVECAA